MCNKTKKKKQHVLCVHVESYRSDVCICDVYLKKKKKTKDGIFSFTFLRGEREREKAGD